MTYEQIAAMAEPGPYRVVTIDNAWSYIIGIPMPASFGPWRYRWEAEEYAEQLNSPLTTGERRK